MVNRIVCLFGSSLALPLLAGAAGVDEDEHGAKAEAEEVEPLLPEVGPHR